MLNLDVSTLIGRGFLEALAEMHWAIDEEDRPFRPCAAQIGGQAPICGAQLSNPMSDGTANTIAVVSWLFLAMGGYDRRFGIPYPSDFLARVQMVGKVKFHFTADVGVDMPNPGASKKERDDYLLRNSALDGQNVQTILDEYQKHSRDSLKKGEVVRGWSPGEPLDSQAPSPPNTAAPQVDLTLVEIVGGEKQLPQISMLEVEGSMGLWGPLAPHRSGREKWAAEAGGGHGRARGWQGPREGLGGATGDADYALTYSQLDPWTAAENFLATQGESFMARLLDYENTDAAAKKSLHDLRKVAPKPAGSPALSRSDANVVRTRPSRPPHHRKNVLGALSRLCCVKLHSLFQGLRLCRRPPLFKSAFS